MLLVPANLGCSNGEGRQGKAGGRAGEGLSTEHVADAAARAMMYADPDQSFPMSSTSQCK